MNKKENFEALMSVVRAYLDREGAIQYDQRAMDRIIQLTQRRAKSLPPEAATEQYTLFLDCSSYMFTLYREAFDFEFPSDLTWHMIDLLEPRVYFYVLTGEETELDKARIKSEIRNTLEPGDVITYDRHTGNGHTMLYIGDGKYTHCTTICSRPNSYDYENKKSREYETGLYVGEVDKMIEERLFNAKNKVRRIAISRPLDRDIKPTKKTLARMTAARGLKLGITSSVTKGRTALVGEEIEYTLTVSAKESTNVSVSFAAPAGALLLGDGRTDFFISENETKKIIFKTAVTAAAEGKIHLDGPRVTVNGLEVFAHKVPLGNRLTPDEICKLNSAMEKEKNLPTALKGAAKAYGSIGIAILDCETDYIRRYFFMYDSTSGDILYRKPQNPQKDGAVYSLFGGIGVTTPENSADPFIRTTKPLRSDLAPGDLIIISDDPYGKSCYSAYYTGEALIGKFESADEPLSTLTGDKVDEFIDSLLGRFAFIVIRPAIRNVLDDTTR